MNDKTEKEIKREYYLMLTEQALKWAQYYLKVSHKLLRKAMDVDYVEIKKEKK